MLIQVTAYTVLDTLVVHAVCSEVDQAGSKWRQLLHTTVDTRDSGQDPLDLAWSIGEALQHEALLHSRRPAVEPPA